MSVAVAVSSPVAADPASGLDNTRTRQIVTGTLTLSGNYGGASTHGDTVNFASPFIQSDYPPTWVEVHADQGAGNSPSLIGYSFRYFAGTTQGNGVLVIGQTGAELAEGSAYSSASPSLNGAVLQFRAEFAKMV